MKAVVIAPDKITRVLVIATLTLTLLSLLEQVIGLTSGLFNLGTDASLPTWYASLSLLFSAILLSFIAMDKRRSRDRYANHWTWLALIFYGLSIDEVAMIHERIGDAFKESALKASLLESSAFPAAIEGIFHYAWVLVAVPAVSIFLLSYFRFVFRLPLQTRVLFITAAAVFLTGAMGVETLAGYQHYLHGNQNWTYELLTTFEELLEMVGVVIFIHALLQYINDSLGQIRLAIADEATKTDALPVPMRKSAVR